ncbi:TPA: NAD(P)-dependent oxidoreductase [Candidatus Dojkabacteria bacterium]|uniref:dTDP-4-dehydrorhamnose reductase n=1 Tax=Candidatus Dojkabacteria bacterium TaxID=2099670 RepID=A0A832QH16_9BACT|nr:NAD(P)-dependent oxidoreductase [Candidatus Dojkabacteria bacterium]
MSKKILVFGANGMLGSYLSNYFGKKGYEVVKTDRDNDDEKKIVGVDITNKKGLQDFVTEQNPDCVINCAAYTNVNQAESEPEVANTVNADAPKYMAEVSKDLNIPLIHISTNEVFGDGEYDEESKEFNPLNEYAKSKRRGEENIENVGGTYYIFRTSWLFGPNAKNFIKFVTETEATEEKPLTIVTDEKGCPTYVGYLTRRMEEAVESKIEPGIYHVCSSDMISRYEFALQILETQGIEKPVIPVEKKDLPPRPVISPSNQLINTKFPEHPTSYEMLVKYVEEMKQDRDNAGKKETVYGN